MQKINKISQEQIQKFPEWVEKWTKIGLETERQNPSNLDLAIEEAKYLYKKIGLKEPTVTLKARSPMEATALGCFSVYFLELFRNLEAEKVSGSQLESLWVHFTSDIQGNYSTKIDQDVLKKCFWEIAGKVLDLTGTSSEEIRIPKKMNSKYLKECFQKEHQNYYGGQMWAPFIAYITFFRDEMGWENKTLEDFGHWERMAVNSGWAWWHEDVFTVSEKPILLYRDAEGRLHNPNGSSIEYRDGFKMSHWHGVQIPNDWTGSKPNLTSEMALKWPNVEQRRCAMEILGWDNILKDLDTKVVDEDEDPMIGTLLETHIEGNKEKFLRVLCGTGRKFCLPVPPEMKTALEANAWTFGFDGKNLMGFIKPEIRT
jgi:hypothetical protein